MNGMWFFGVMALLAGALLFSAQRRFRRYWRTLRHGKYIDLTVQESSLTQDHGLGGTVFMSALLVASLPDGTTTRAVARIPVHPDRLDEVQPGCVLRGRVDPLGDSEGYNYIQHDFDHLADGKSGGEVKR